MITFHRILELYKFEPGKIKLVRHGNKEIPIRETFINNISRLEAYQSFQKQNKYGNATALAVFAPYYKTTALFLGIWDILGCVENSEFTQEIAAILKANELPESWYENSVMYHLKRNNTLDEMTERIVIEWGAATVAWVQSKDKEVVEIKGKNSIGDFQSFNLIDLAFSDLKKLVRFPDTNLSWVKALSSVNGIYLLKDKTSGKLYIGSAYGEHGIYGRWSTYAKNGHGGNQELLDLNPANFYFSVLEILPATATPDDVINCENIWKQKLGTRKFGLNNN